MRVQRESGWKAKSGAPVSWGLEGEGEESRKERRLWLQSHEDEVLFTRKSTAPSGPKKKSMRRCNLAEICIQDLDYYSIATLLKLCYVRIPRCRKYYPVRRRIHLVPKYFTHYSDQTRPGDALSEFGPFASLVTTKLPPHSTSET